MEKVLEILEFEDKETKAGKSYTRFKTPEGWMSCFDKKSNEELKKMEGKTANVEVVESGDFKNIKKFIGLASEEVNAKVEKPGEIKKSHNGKKEMYVSYAKDCFCAIVGRISQAKFDEMSEENVLNLMNLSISAVKKAEEAF